MFTETLKHKMRYSKKTNSEERYRQKLNQANLEASSDAESDLGDGPVATQVRSVEPTRKKKKRNTGYRSTIEANKIHTKMRNRAMQIMDEIESVLEDTHTSKLTNFLTLNGLE